MKELAIYGSACIALGLFCGIVIGVLIGRASVPDEFETVKDARRWGEKSYGGTD